MNVLLDTHVLIRWFDDHDRLSQAREKGITPTRILRSALSFPLLQKRLGSGYCRTASRVTR